VSDNPLLRYGQLPAFAAIRAEQILPALNQQLAENRSLIAALVADDAPAAWDNLALPLEEAGDKLDQLWAPVSHLHGVRNSDALRAAYDAALPLLTDYATELGQNRGLYERYQALADSAGFAALDGPRQQAIRHALRDFKLSGVALEGEARARYGAIQQRLAELGNRFSNNVLDATQGWTLHIEDAAQLAGLPDSALTLYREAAASRGLTGWFITLDVPAYLPAMQYAEDRALRETLYRAYTTRASDQGPCAGRWDNSALITEILALRHELAQLLGFANYAELSMAPKMAESAAQVLDFLHELAARSRPVAAQDYAELQAFARDELGLPALAAWDIPYASEKLRLSRYALSQEQLRPYFPAERVIEGLFGIVWKLFGVQFRRAEAETWHPDVRYYEVLREGEVIASFYFDLYAREHKRGGAWMADCRTRRRRADGALQLPVAFLTCNFTPPTADAPSLLTHDEVTTLFHEFGHGLHHMLTRIDCAAVAGINGVAWDAVELPSQFLENWCWEKEAIALISGHYQTGKPLPAALLDKMLAAKNFQSGMQMQRQLEFALFDLQLHAGYDPASPRPVQAVLDDVRAEVAVYPQPDFNRFQHSFSHIFAGGYAAGYYSYKWAEVLSADAFARFEEDGVFNADTGEQFRTAILEQGGSRDAMDLFMAFRGREPRVDALLRHSGITQQEVSA
jgi:oligopeptidase A